MKKYTYSALIALLTASQALAQAAPVGNSQPPSPPTPSFLRYNNMTVNNPKDGDVIKLHSGQGLSIVFHDTQIDTREGSNDWLEENGTWSFNENSNDGVLGVVEELSKDHRQPNPYADRLPDREMDPLPKRDVAPNIDPPMPPMPPTGPLKIITPRVFECSAVAPGQAVLTFTRQDSFSGHGQIAVPECIEITQCHITVKVVE